jgi:hypothetical protein
VCWVIGSIGICVACGTRILWTDVLNTLIIRFMVSNRNIVVAKNKLCNNLKPFFRVCDRCREKRSHILDLIHIKCVMVEDLRRDRKHFDSYIHILDFDPEF